MGLILSLQIFLTNKLNFLGGKQGFYKYIIFQNKLCVYKTNVCFEKDKKIPFKYYFHINVSQKNCFLKALSFFQLISNQKTYNNHSIGTKAKP